MIVRTRTALTAFTVCLAAVVNLSPAVHSAEKKAAGKHFLWVVKSKTATVYLLGSIHVARKSLYPLDPVIENAFQKSDTLVLEVPLDLKTQLEAQTKLLKVARYGAGDSLPKHLDKETKKLLDAHLKKSGVPSGSYDQFKPWLVSIIITFTELKKHGFSPNFGIDRHFFKKASGKKTVVGLETVDDQVKMFATLSEKMQASMLKQTLQEVGESAKMIAKTFKLWKSGRAKELDELLLKPMRKPENRPLYKAVFVDRNIKMTAKIEGFLKTNKTWFVVVGAGHLVGKEGIIKLLQARKHSIKQL
ncbi:MAG: TraB/GumN family protein [Planctomycetes bacterium]|nr:TraB/GumN family protein [Planctomycetota bacterium]